MQKLALLIREHLNSDSSGNHCHTYILFHKFLAREIGRVVQKGWGVLWHGPGKEKIGDHGYKNVFFSKHQCKQVRYSF